MSRQEKRERETKADPACGTEARCTAEPADPTSVDNLPNRKVPDSPNESEDAASSPSAAVELAAEVARLTEELRQANDQALRSQAELENFRKRMRREMEEERKYASLPLIVELLNVLDNLAWAIEAGQNATQTMALSDGVKMVAAQLTTLLGKHHCQAIPTIGKEFDPHLHEALAKEPSELHPEGVITRAARSGYRLHDRVIRPAQVFVSSGNPPAPAAEPPGTVESMANPE